MEDSLMAWRTESDKKKEPIKKLQEGRQKPNNRPRALAFGACRTHDFGYHTNPRLALRPPSSAETRLTYSAKKPKSQPGERSFDLLVGKEDHPREFVLSSHRIVPNRTASRFFTLRDKRQRLAPLLLL